MRQIGSLNREADARRFADFLITEGFGAHAEQAGDSWVVWVRDENHIESARAAFAEFQSNPQDLKYRNLQREASLILRTDAKRRELARKNLVPVRWKWGVVSRGGRPLVWTLIILSCGVGLFSNMGRDTDSVVVRTLLFTDPAHARESGWSLASTADRLVDIQHGQAWRFITPMFVHYGTIHLAFNMIMLYQLGSLIELRRGTWRLGLMVLAIAASSNTAQALVPIDWGGSPFAAGMSGVVYGLFGYVWMKTLYAPRMGMFVSRSTVVILLAWLLLGFAGFLNRGDTAIANWTHGVGFAAGVAIGYIPEVLGGGA
jgi:GlpG protein